MKLLQTFLTLIVAILAVFLFAPLAVAIGLTIGAVRASYGLLGTIGTELSVFAKTVCSELRNQLLIIWHS